MTVNIKMKFRAHTGNLDKITKRNASNILADIADSILDDANNLVPKRYGNLITTAITYELEGTPEHVVTYIASYGRGEEGRQYYKFVKKRGLVPARHPKYYAIPQHIGAPDGNPIAWGHLTKLEYSVPGTQKEYLLDVFNEWPKQALQMLADNLLKK